LTISCIGFGGSCVSWLYGYTGTSGMPYLVYPKVEI